MEHNCVRRCGLVVLLLAMSIAAGQASAQAPQQTGLVILFGDERVETRCVALDGEKTSGCDVLARSGLDTIVDPSSGMGVTVCRIEDVGCDFPGEDCFCQCRGGGECAYWTYFYREPGDGPWVYSALGAALRKATPGGVEGWVWGDGSIAPPEEYTFVAICPSPTSMPVDTPDQPTVGVATATAATSPAGEGLPTEPPSPLPSPTIPAATVAPVPTPGTVASSGVSNYWVFGLMILGLVAVGVLVWRRRA